MTKFDKDAVLDWESVLYAAVIKQTWWWGPDGAELVSFGQPPSIRCRAGAPAHQHQAGMVFPADCLS
jgi:hypothetical protein